MKTIGVFFGSRSTEHDVSIITGQLIISGLCGLGYDVVPVYITRDGEWMIDESLGKLASFTDPKVRIEEKTSFKQYLLDLQNSRGKMVFKKKGIVGKSITIDLAFPAFHGAYGEDGTIQGLFEMLDVPYVGCDVASSAISMDKALTKQLCEVNGIPTTKYGVFRKKDWDSNKKFIVDRIQKMKWPVFVKPVHLGSSIGIAKVKDEKDLENKIEVALYYDDKVLVEEGVDNLMDVTCCIIGNDDLTASELQESVFQAELFDFEEKYLKDGGAQLGKAESGLVIPARLDRGMTKKIQEMAKKVYTSVGCCGIARVDFLLDKKTNEVFANEINPLPGTVYHHLWEKSGVPLHDLLSKLIKFAEEKHAAKKDFTHTFKSALLSGLNSSKMGIKGGKLKQ
ncbi:MAG: D-alanine--D-alanine ligase family protein [Patescibacteria group bacterium]